MQALGVRLCLDDFGTGYSSLSYLNRLPVSALKIDRSFLQKMESSSEHYGIVRAILDLANTLKMEVVAEGMRPNDSSARLKEMKCRLGQGFLFSRPQDVESVAALLPLSKKTGDMCVNY